METTDNIEQQALALAQEHCKTITQENNHLAQQMVDKGYSPDEWVIMSNFGEFILGREPTYMCWASKKEPNKLTGEQ